MASSSRRWRATAALLAATCLGCWTGRIFEAGRVREQVIDFRGAALGRDSLRLDYTVELSGRGTAPGRRAERAASMSLAALSAEPAYPVDAFPLERISSGSPLEGARPIPILDAAAVPEAQHAALPSGPATDPWLLRLENSASGHELLRLCPGDGAACVGQLYSAALYRDHTAWWVYPLLPLGVAVDIALLPFQFVTTAPFFLLGD